MDYVGLFQVYLIYIDTSFNVGYHVFNFKYVYQVNILTKKNGAPKYRSLCLMDANQALY